MTRGGLETACWDLEARRQGVPLWRLIGGGARRAIPCGVSIGIQDSVAQLIAKIGRELAAGYQRIKIKIKPGWDIDVVAAVRREFPEILLMADANSAYTLADIEHLKRLDEFNLMMIEQPLAHDEILDHAKLQAALVTPICLGRMHPHRAPRRAGHRAERPAASSTSSWAAWAAFAEAKRVHDVCQAHGIPVWSGGMLEAGIGRAHNIAMATLPNFTLPGDISASRRYWQRDIISPWVETTPRGTIEIGDAPGFGYRSRPGLSRQRARARGDLPQLVKPSPRRLYALIGLMTFFWGINYIAAKFAIRAFPPLLIGPLRAGYRRPSCCCLSTSGNVRVGARRTPGASARSPGSPCSACSASP